jgi:hypothetical protein
MLHCNGFRDLISRLTGAELTHITLVTMTLLQIILHILNPGHCMVPVLRYKVNIYYVLDTQLGFSKW